MCGVNGIDLGSDNGVKGRVRNGRLLEYGGEGDESFVFVGRNDSKARLYIGDRKMEWLANSVNLAKFNEYRS